MISITFISLSLLTLTNTNEHPSKFAVEESYMRQFALINFHPYLATIRPRNETNTEDDCLLTGTIIAQKWILTNALAIINNRIDTHPSDFLLIAGTTNCPGSETGTRRVPITNATIHPEFDRENHNKLRHNDIALVLLEDELKFTNKINNVLLPDGENSESVCASIGLGSGKRLKISTQVPFEEMRCQEVRQVSWKEFCTVGYQDRDCYRITTDLGTPLMCDYVQVGLLTFDGQCESRGPLVWINVEFYMTWIGEVTGSRFGDIKRKKSHSLPKIARGGGGRKFAESFIMFIVFCKEICYVIGV